MSYEKRRARSISSKSYSAISVTEFPARSQRFVFSSLIFAASTCRERSVMCARVKVCSRVVFAGKAREPIMKMAAETNGIIEP